MLLQPTSPLRIEKDVLSAVYTFQETGYNDTKVSVCEVDHPKARIGLIEAGAKFSGIDLSGKRSQAYHAEYRLNGAVYVFRADVLLSRHSLFTENLRASIMPRERSFDTDEHIVFVPVKV